MTASAAHSAAESASPMPPKDPIAAAEDRSMITVQQHIFEQQRHHFPAATGEFSWLLSGITLATKRVQAKVRRAGLTDLLGSDGEVNVQGEVQQKLDVYANDVLIQALSSRDCVGVLASEENDHPMAITRNQMNAKYAVVFDPLDGSSNIDVNVSVGTIFSILRLPGHSHGGDRADDLLQHGYRQVAAGYVCYGSSTILVYTAGMGVHGFTLDPSIGAFVLSHENITMPDRGKYYSVNEAYRDSFPPEYRTFLDRLRTGKLGDPYGLRYIGSLVADFHRTLLKGGIFLYPPTNTHPEGKLRLLYEANPIAFIAEQAGGMASAGSERILDIKPTSIHQRTAFIVGSKTEMDEFERCINGRG